LLSRESTLPRLDFFNIPYPQTVVLRLDITDANCVHASDLNP
jgi:hypothetical protein